MPGGLFAGLISSHEHWESGFSHVATLRYTCHNQQRITSKSYSALGEGLMGRRDSIPDLLVQNLSWRW